MNTDNIKIMVRGAYDVQKLRVGMGNRICSNFRAKLGLGPSESEEEDDDAKGILDDLRARYKKLTDGVKTFPKQATFVGDGVISTYTELSLVSQYIDLEKIEATHFHRLEATLKEYPIYNTFLVAVKGCVPAMSGVILSEIDITKARYPSSLWAYAGLDVAGDGKGRSRKQEHLVEKAYTDKDGNPAKRVGITFNPFLKTKLYVLATCMIKLNSQPYRTIYDDYKHRLESNPKWADESKGHRNNAAMRYMLKRFLVDLYKAWRSLEGLPVAPEYSVGKLGIVHSREP
jgi:hypothetical protein